MSWLLPAVLLVVPALVLTQDRPVCSANQVYNGQICTCAPGYFSSNDDASKKQCDAECDEVYNTYFTYGKCVSGIFGKVPSDQQPDCNMRCGVRPRILTTIGIFVILAAALATLVLMLPMCITICCSCLHAKKANKNAKRVVLESQSAPSKDQQVATMGYNPYAYWPYYGRA